MLTKGRVRANDLQRMSNVTHETRRQLRAQGLPVEHWDFFMVHMLHERLDEETAKQWELQRDSDTPSVDDMLAFIDKQAKALANIGETRRRLESVAVVPDNQNYGARSTGARVNEGATTSKPKPKEAKPITCAACDESHMLYHCPEFLSLSVAARKEFVERRSLCPNCFKRGHGADRCFGDTCWKCPGNPKHNSTLCPARASVRRVQCLQQQGNQPGAD